MKKLLVSAMAIAFLFAVSNVAVMAKDTKKETKKECTKKCDKEKKTCCKDEKKSCDKK
ncbi:MAG: hypothetical protein LBM08_05240 [Dysgonamonadaceae bacterium]|nr:hypothetical protein [Dysgonamonadaceae bacterium]